jgi:hypothetical protein
MQHDVPEIVHEDVRAERHKLTGMISWFCVHIVHFVQMSHERDGHNINCNKKAILI